MTKEIEKSKSRGKTMLKALAVATISGLVWKFVLHLLGGKNWEN